MELFLIVVIVIAAVPYVLGPIRIHQRHRQPARPAFVPFDPARHPFPADLAGDIRKNVELLGRAGFAVVADLFRGDQATRMRVMLLDTPAGEVALVSGAFPARLPQGGACHVEFIARFEGERSFSVLNHVPGIFPAVPGKEKVRVREVRDPERLFRVYQTLLARRYGAVKREPLEVRADPAGFLSAAMARELRQQVDTGYYRLDAAADAFRPTWKGAFLMSWKLLSPMREIRLWLADRRGRALLRELHLESRDANPVGSRRRYTFQWNWIGLTAAVVLLVVHPSWLDPRRSVPGRPTPVRLPAGFTVPGDFPGAVKALEQLVGATASPLVALDSLGRSVRTAGVVVPVEGSRAPGLVAAAQASFLARGFYLFRVAQHFGIRDVPDTLALYPSGDRYAILRLIGTNGVNYDIGPDSIAAWLEALERDQPFVLTGIGFDWLEGWFTTPLADAGGLARRFDAFCPDIVTQGTGTVAALARELRRSSQWYCWWD